MPDGTSLVWVKVPIVAAGARAQLYTIYGNASAPSGENRTANWADRYAAVWHMNGKLIDSTGNSNDASDVGGSSDETL